jgi:uncharacterized membrane protein
MTPLIAGLALFLGIHLLPSATGLRERMRTALGANRYRSVFSLITAAGLGLIIYGKSVAPFVPVWTGWAPGRHLALMLMPFAFILFAAANMPGHIRARLRHPMLLGTLLWAGVHLSVNGDLASMLLFGGFLAWAALDLVSASIRGKTLIGDKPPAWRFDAIAVVAGSVLFLVVARFHAQLFGPPVWPG